MSTWTRRAITLSRKACTAKSFTSLLNYDRYYCGQVCIQCYLRSIIISANTPKLNFKSTILISPIKSRSISHDTRIGSQQLRLLQIINPNETAQGQTKTLSCKTKVFPLRDAPPFRALSYTWGAPYTFRHGGATAHSSLNSNEGDTFVQNEVSCDGRIVKVGANIHNALLHLRKNVLQDGQWVWVDTLCINQNDAVEKTAQVAIMSEIYTQAREVLVWLGPVPEGRDKDLAEMATLIDDFMDKLTQLAVEDHLRIPSSKEIQNLVPLDSNLIHDINIAQAVGMPNLSERFAYLAYFVMNCRWFDRVWTMQELVLNSKPRMMCGQYEFSWANLSSLVTFMESIDLVFTLNSLIESLNSGPLTQESLQGLQRMRTICHIRDRNLEDHHFHIEDETNQLLTKSELYMDSIYLTLLLRHAWDARCADDRDRVAGILGMANSWYDRRLVEAITVNYSHGVSEILINTTKAILQHSRSLDVLTMLPFTTKSKDYKPSWVFQAAEPLSHRGPNLLPYNYAASAGLHHISEGFSIRDVELYCSGFCFDIIDDVANYDPLINNNDLAPECLRLGAQLPRVVGGKSRVQHLWQTLLMADDVVTFPDKSYEPQFWRFIANAFAQKAYSKATDDQLDPEQVFKAMSVLLDNFCLGLSDGSNTETVMKDARRMFNTLGDTEHQKPTNVVVDDGLMDAETSFAEVSSRCFLLEKGMLGLGPNQVRRGDEIWTMASGNVPFILRPSPKARVYTFVGHCFVSGHMYGEMLDTRYGYKGVESVSNIKII